MESLTNESVLTLKKDLDLTSDHQIVTSVLQSKYETLVIESLKNVFHSSFRNSEKFEYFWRKLAESVVILELHVHNVAMEDVSLIWNYFVNLRELRVVSTRKLVHDLSKFCQNNTQLETLIFSPLCVVTEKVHNDQGEKELDFSESFKNMLNYLHNIKKLVFDFHLQLHEWETEKQFFDMQNYKFWQMFEISFKPESLPSIEDCPTYCWVTERIELEFIRDDDVSKLVIKPLTLEEEPVVDPQPCLKRCRTRHGIIESDSVLQLTFNYYLETRCPKYLKSCIENFPHLTTIYADAFLSKSDLILKLISKLEHLTTCYLRFETSCVNWPVFPRMTHFGLIFEDATYETFESFVKAFPNVTYLCVRLRQGITSDDCILLISRHIKTLTTLFIECDGSKCTGVGLKIIGNNLRTLEHLKINCDESQGELERLWELPHLQVIDTGNREFLRPLIEERHEIPDVIDKPSPVPCVIQNLPSEVLEEIFLYLNKNETLNCRRVCKAWYYVFSSSAILDRTLSLTNSYLCVNANPVKFLMETEFIFNRLFIDETTTFETTKIDTLIKFWERIGKNIRDIFLKGEDLKLKDAFDTGLQPSHFPSLQRLTLGYVRYFSKLLAEENIIWKSLLQNVKIFVWAELTPQVPLEEDINHHPPFTMSLVDTLEIYFNDETYIPYVSQYLTFPSLRTFIIVSQSDTTIQSLKNLNFLSTITRLYIAKFREWTNDDFDVICKECTKLQSLGICMMGVQTFDSKFCKPIVAKLFEKLTLTLTHVYFMKFNFREGKIEQRMLYRRKASRVGIPEMFSEPNTFFDNICVKNLRSYGFLPD